MFPNFSFSVKKIREGAEELFESIFRVQTRTPPLIYFDSGRCASWEVAHLMVKEAHR